MKDKVLFISNGYGEDTISSYIAKEFKQQFLVYALPLVGKGKIYQNFNIPVITNKNIVNLPSKGISGFTNLKNLLLDIKSGLIKTQFEYIKLIKKLDKYIKFTIAVGDIYPFLLAYLFSKKPVYYIGTAKSNYVVKHSIFEIMLLKKAKLSFFRDKQTADYMKKKGIKNAIYVGNAMLDCINYSNKIWKDDLIIGVLPGSRDKAFENFSFQIKVIENIYKILNKKITILVSKFLQLDINEFIKILKNNNWQDISIIQDKYIKLKAKKQDLKIIFLQDALGDILKYSYIILGQAGTANEQAVGFEKPVIVFENLSKNLNWYRWRQKKLLSNSIKIVDKNIDKITKEFLNIYNNKDLYNKMAEIGKKRMGEKGAVKRIAKTIIQNYFNFNNNNN